MATEAALRRAQQQRWPEQARQPTSTLLPAYCVRAALAQERARAGATQRSSAVGRAALEVAAVGGGQEAKTGSAPLGMVEGCACCATAAAGLGGVGVGGEQLSGEPRRVGALEAGRELLVSLSRSHSSVAYLW